MVGRREILGLLGVMASGPTMARSLAAEKVVPRKPWPAFAGSKDYGRLVDAVRRMKANRDAEDPASWTFWSNVHQAHCPHNSGYFLAWHRGYLHLFERKLREITRTDGFRLPYWNYFASPDLPEELTTGDAATNPLFENRKATSVHNALSYAAFAPALTGFARAPTATFEGQIEACHNNIHNLVGGWMASIQSPHDMLFWLHHANIDRLWAAWVAAGQGRKMPPSGDEYWKGSLDYAERLSLPRDRAIDCEALGYRYEDLSLPQAIPEPVVVAVPSPAPPPPAPPPPAAAPPPVAAPAPAAPPPAAPIPMRAVFLDEDWLTLRLPVLRRQPEPMRDMAPMPGGIAVVLDALTLTQEGAQGGYFYNIYLRTDDAAEDFDACLLGSIGPFQIDVALRHAHHGEARIVLPARELVERLAPGREVGTLRVTFVRVSADGAPKGETIGIGSLSIEG